MGILEIQNRIIKNFKILGLTKVLSGIASALTIFLLARKLGVEKFGILSISIAFVEVLNIILSLRIWEATTKFLGDIKENKESSSNLIINSITLAIKSSAFACLIICFFSYNYSSLIFNYQIDITKIIIIYSLFYVVFTANEVIDSSLRTFNSYKRILFNNVTSNFLRLILVFIALSLSDDLITIVSALGLSILISFFIKTWSLLRFMQNSNMPINFTNKNYPSTFMTYVFSTHFSNIINLANEKNLGVLLVGYIVGPFYAGLFKAARSIVKIIRRIMDPLLDIAFPEFVSLVNEGRLNDLIRLIGKSTKILGLISLAVGAVLFVLSEEIITLFFGVKYIAAHTALSLLVIASLINNISYWITPAILALGKPRYLLIISSFVSVVYIATLYPLVINFNHDGAALSGLLRAFSVFLVGIILFRIALKKKIT